MGIPHSLPLTYATFTDNAANMGFGSPVQIKSAPFNSEAAGFHRVLCHGKVTLLTKFLEGVYGRNSSRQEGYGFSVDSHFSDPNF